MNPALAGHRLVGREYEPIPGIELPDGTLTIHSPTLGLDLRLKGKDMRFFDPVRGQHMLTITEMVVQTRAAEAELHAAEAEARAAKAEAELRVAKAKARAAQAELRAVETRIAELELDLAEKGRG